MKNFKFLMVPLCLFLLFAGCKKEVGGCTDPLATNYNPSATFENGTCNYISGCTDPDGVNYNSSATQDDGSCRYEGQVTFWQSGTPSYGVTNVTLSGTMRQITSDYPSGVTSCGLSGCANFTLEEGTYSYSAEEQVLFGATWIGTVTVIRNRCSVIRLL